MAKKIKSNWTTHIISLLVSLIFVPVALLGQVGGNIIGGFFVWFNKESFSTYMVIDFKFAFIFFCN